MSDFTAAFRATPAGLDRIATGWLCPLSAPLRVKRINPFTGTPFEKVTSDPRDVDGFNERDVPEPDLTNVVHIGIGTISDTVVSVLCALVGVPVELPEVRFPTHDGLPIWELPRDACDALSRLSGADRRALAERWLVDPDLIIPAFSSSTLEPAMAEQALAELSALCAARGEDERVYLWTQL